MVAAAIRTAIRAITDSGRGSPTPSFVFHQDAEKPQTGSAPARMSAPFATATFESGPSQPQLDQNVISAFNSDGESPNTVAARPGTHPPRALGVPMGETLRLSRRAQAAPRAGVGHHPRRARHQPPGGEEATQAQRRRGLDAPEGRVCGQPPECSQRGPFRRYVHSQGGGGSTHRSRRAYRGPCQSDMRSPRRAKLG